MDAVRTTMASVYSQMWSQQLAAASALACIIAFFMMRPIITFFSWIMLHISPMLQGKKLPPGSLGFLWIEETLGFISSLRHAGGPTKFMTDRTAKFASDTFKTSIFLHPTVIVQGAAANRFVATGENKQDLLNSWPSSTLELLGRNVPVAVHGAKHKRQRQIMSTCLGPAGLQKVVARADRLTEEHFEAVWKEGEQISIVASLKMHVFRIACSLLAGTEDEQLLKRMEAQFRTWIAGMADVPLDVPGTAYYRAKRARDSLRRDINRVIQQRQQELQHAERPQQHEDLLSQLILARDDNGCSLNSDELRDVSLFLLFAGHDTAATTLMFALKFLEENLSCRDRLLQEHDAIASQRNPGEPLKWTDITNMKYTWAVLQETMRLRSPVMGGIKEAQKDLKYNGYTIPKGWKVFFAMSSTHENDQYFKDSSNFDPSRFEVERLQKEAPQPFSFVPFGVGPHACKGGDFARMNMSLYIHYLIMSKMKWTSLDPHEKYHCFPLLTLSKGYPVIISREKSPLMVNGLDN